MATIPLAPVNLTLAIVRGFNSPFKLVPKNPDGTIFDCTTITTVNFICQSSLAEGAPQQSIAASGVSGDATGCVGYLDPSVQTTLIDALGLVNGSYISQMGDGTNEYNSTYGTYTIQNVVAP